MMSAYRSRLRAEGLRDDKAFPTDTPLADRFGTRNPPAPTPFSPFEALLDKGEHESVEEQHERLQYVVDAVEQALDPLERRVIEAKFWGGMGLTRMSRELGIPRTTLSRVRDNAFAKIAAHINENKETTE